MGMGILILLVHFIFFLIKKLQNIFEIEKKSEIYKSFRTKEKVEFQWLSFSQMFEKYM